MSKSIHSIIPNADVILAMEPEEVAGIILEYLNDQPPDAIPNRYNFSLSYTVREYPEESRRRIQENLMEGWSWLEREGFIAPKPGQQGDEIFVTRRGRMVNMGDQLKAYRLTDLLPRRLLHPIITQKIWSTFIRGEYDTAVFRAFKEVEVAVRNAAGYDAIEIGIALMRKAFDPNNGPLTNKAVPGPERSALQHLFAGAIGSYKNPQSHRQVAIQDPTEAAEMIILASHLLRIVDSRKEAG